MNKYSKVHAFPTLSLGDDPIRWRHYLSEEAVFRFTRMWAAETPHEGYMDIWKNWFPSLTVRDQVRFNHLECQYAAYTTPNPPKYCVWLPELEIRERVMELCVPPFDRWEYEISPLDCEPYAIEQVLATMDEENAILERSQLLLTAEDKRQRSFYEGLPVNIEAAQDEGRWIQWDY